MRSIQSPAADDSGSAVAEFVFVSILLAALALGLIQLTLVLHVRNTLLASASDGAHIAALADRSEGDGRRRAIEVAEAALGGRSVTVTATTSVVGGVATVEVVAATALPAFLWWGEGQITARAHAIEER